MNQAEYKRISKLIEDHFQAQLDKIPREINNDAIERRKSEITKRLKVKARIDKMLALRAQADEIEQKLLSELEALRPALAEEAAQYNRHSEPRVDKPEKFVHWMAVVEENQAADIQSRKAAIKSECRKALATLELIADSEQLRQLFDNIGLKLVS